MVDRGLNRDSVTGALHPKCLGICGRIFKTLNDKRDTIKMGDNQSYFPTLKNHMVSFLKKETKLITIPYLVLSIGLKVIVL